MFSSMRSFMSRLFILILVTAACQATADDNRKLLVVGDSLSAGFGIGVEQGWVTLLQQRLDKEGYGYEVVNASISGDTTTGGLNRLPRALDKHRPDVVIIELGGNDALRGTSVSLIYRNLARMIEASCDTGAQVVLAGIQIPPNYGPAYTSAFARMYPQLAEEYDVALIDFFMDKVALDPALMQPDGIHPNADGQPLLLDNVWAVLKPELEATVAAN